LNATVENDNKGLEKVMGNFGYGNKNECEEIHQTSIRLATDRWWVRLPAVLPFFTHMCLYLFWRKGNI